MNKANIKWQQILRHSYEWNSSLYNILKTLHDNPTKTTQAYRVIFYFNDVCKQSYEYINKQILIDELQELKKILEEDWTFDELIDELIDSLIVNDNRIMLIERGVCK